MVYVYFVNVKDLCVCVCVCLVLELIYDAHLTCLCLFIGFAPEDATSCCSSGMIGSLIRAMTTSFGSICFGSLLVAIVQATRALAEAARNNDNQILVCIADCLLSCLQSILEYFNKWAFVYVGLYGYSYIEAGKSEFVLFCCEFMCSI